MIRLPLALALALLLLLPVGCAPSIGHVALEGRAPAAIEVEGGSLIVPVLLNGRGPFPMILDNGVMGAAVIDRRIAAPLGLSLPQGGDERAARSDGGDIATWPATLSRVQVANLAMAQVPVAVADLPPALRHRPGGGEIAGFVGAALFEHHAVRLDLLDRTLTFLPPDLEHSDDGAGIRGKVRAGEMLFPAQVNGTDLTLSLDLGYGLAPLALDRRAAERVVGVAALKDAPSYEAITAGGPVSGRRLVIDHLTLGAITRRNVPATVLPDGAAGAWQSDGYLGLPLFMGCRSVINQPMQLIMVDCPVLPD
ncbi:pepsin/retropepsin-like aspartic protease family protein [Niveispirillum irakense]|uniref:pepsin/retropepsin-like aspartic protease family protein n=1 Tax=Niveispirillum irakense TaxID=34011 RepID=UPI0004910B6C|nr:pepsin/retropepsin-like aspartic protease family protein [Niveispirillum irakense]